MATLREMVKAWNDGFSVASKRAKFGFSPTTGDYIRLSFYGLAIHLLPYYKLLNRKRKARFRQILSKLSYG